VICDDFKTLRLAHKKDRALVFRGDEFSAAQVDEAAERLAAALSGLGVTMRHRIGILFGNSPLFVCSLLAVIKLRASAVLLSPNCTKYELEGYIRDTGIRLLLSEKKNDQLLQALAARSRLVHQDMYVDYGHINAWGLDDEGLRGEIVDVPPEWTEKELTLQFTSGVGGKSKIVPRSYANLAEELNSFSRSLGITDKDVVLCPAPLFHTYGLVNGFLLPFFAGADVILMDWFMPNDLVEAVQQYRPTILIGVPIMYKMVAGTYTERPADFSSLRVCFSAGAKLSDDISRSFTRRYGLRINQQYGSSETGVIAINLFEDGLDDAGSVGRPVSGRSIRIVDENGGEVEKGRDGEITVHSRATTRGYLHLDELNRQKFRDGWYFTGDIGHVDRDGNLFITGRKSAFINVSGYKVDPAEVEGVLATHPNIRDCAVVGKAENSGDREVVKAYVVTGGSLSQADVIAYCKERLASHKVPRQVEFIEQLPRSPTGKVLLKYLVG
jgi:long-chain acyl-CoA synthetase